MRRQETKLSHLGLHLVHAGILEKQFADEAAEDAENQNIPFITWLVKNAILTGETILNACQNIFLLPVFNMQDYDESLIDLLEIELIRQYRIIPLWKNHSILHIGMSDPTDQDAIDAVAFQTRLHVKIFLINEEERLKWMESFYNDQETNKNIQDNLLRQITLDQKQDIIHDKIMTQDEPLIQFVDNIILHAFDQSVSDIHIESYEHYCRIRYRQHGILFSVNEIPLLMASRVITRLKVMANLNIAEKRLPQDGRFKLDTIDIRINTCPALFGEKVVLRILNSNHTSLDIYQLGLTEQQKNIFIKAISRTQGMILVTGPTGSGKTVTLYSALDYLNHSEKNISTVEDPVEIYLNGINQVNINQKIGLTFSNTLRTFLRQDPDIIMVGEIRDLETAEIAIQASQTGHLVLSTFHTNSAIETITRLRAIGIPNYNISGPLSLIVAQRLLRKLCDECKLPEKRDQQHDFLFDKSDVVYKANGCSQCSNGYKNRIAIYECLPVTENINQLILNKCTKQQLLSSAKEEGFITLKDIAIQHVLNGITSFTEMNRVLL